jgi:acetate kinase
MNILVLNCGSSSIKYQVIDMNEASHKLLAKGLVDRIGQAEGDLKHKPVGKEPFELHQPIADHNVGIDLILKALIDPVHGVINSYDEIKAVGHRVAHGGEHFKGSALVTPDSIEKVRDCIKMAPLHNPANLQGALSMAEILPNIPQVFTFDTAFHQTIPAHNYLYAIPYKYYTEEKIRKYGFHGTSHKYVAKVAAEMVGLDVEKSRIVTCHVGNGASITAVKFGKSFNTSMGFTPADGLCMGTRSGQIDPCALIHIARNENMTYDQMDAFINKKSGIQGLTGISSDMRDIDDAYDAGNEKAIVARDMYYNRVKKFVGEYAAEMGGVDLLIFTGGVGENSADLRRYVCENMQFMGIEIDESINIKTRGTNTLLSTPEAKVKVAVIATNEELVIATDTYNLTKNL